MERIRIVEIIGEFRDQDSDHIHGLNVKFTTEDGTIVKLYRGKLEINRETDIIPVCLSTDENKRFIGIITEEMYDFLKDNLYIVPVKTYSETIGVSIRTVNNTKIIDAICEGLGVQSDYVARYLSDLFR